MMISMKKGISLIVLVITIIVMIILAGAIILTLSNNGIIGKASDAVEKSDEVAVNQLAQMTWAEAYVDGVRRVDNEKKADGTIVKGFKARVYEALIANGIDTTKYIIAVNEKGIEVKEKTSAWVQEGLKIIRGKDELAIGQTVKYEAGVQGYTGGWKVLGADETGNLLIMSAADIKTSYSLDTDTLKKAQNTWLSDGVAKLDNECKPYGKGTYANGARSIRVEDIDKVTGYDKVASFATGYLHEYGNEVTYKYNGTIQPAYKGTNNVAGTLEHEYTNGFYWYDEKGFHNVSAEDLTNEENKDNEIAKITSNAYSYSGTSTGKLTSSSDAYKMIFGTSDNWNFYWLASPCVGTNTGLAVFGMSSIMDGKLYGYTLWSSTGKIYTPTSGVRAVVTLQYNIPMENLVK